LTLLAVTISLLVGCAETQVAFHTAKRIEKLSSSTPEPRYKIGKPYPINGVFYYPAVNYSYQESGIASWYGEKFHGRPTANGEIFDMNQLTAAHRTLPLPSMVRVINLENGRALRVRVNDRGPFSRGRIIDLSRRAAQLLGFRYKGTARVRVEILANESRDLAAHMGVPIVPGAGLVAHLVPPKITSEPLEPIGAVLSPNGSFRWTPQLPPANSRAPGLQALATNQTTARIHQKVTVTEIYIQAGAFVRYPNADRARIKLARHGRASVVKTRVGGKNYFRVRVGPIATVKAADRLLARVSASGYPRARIVVE
jgi:rare lipoprotein A